jgi:hypothetical protein
MKTAGRIATTKALVAVAGLVAIGFALATGNWPVVMLAASVTSGAGLLAAVADLRAVEARCEATGRLHQMEAAIERERGRQVDIKEKMAELRSYYAGLDGVEGDSGRFRERLSSEPEPGWDRHQ